jgi:hypothetical protein
MWRTKKYGSKRRSDAQDACQNPEHNCADMMTAGGFQSLMPSAAADF